MPVAPWRDNTASCQGKVRDTYDCGENIVIVTSDRQSAFDRLLASVPYKVCLKCMLHNHLLLVRTICTELGYTTRSQLSLLVYITACKACLLHVHLAHHNHLLLSENTSKAAMCRVLTFQGQVLNQTSAWWMQHTIHITPNALLATPDPNVAVMKKCQVLPIEFVVRGFMTGVLVTTAS